MILKLEKQDTVTHSAFTQARANLNYTAFIELNQRAVVQTTYNTPDYKQFKGLRVLAIDGSLIRLPRTQSTIDVFGSRPYSNGASSSQSGEHTYAMASVLYDVLNNVAIHSQLTHGDASELNLAIEHLAHTSDNDLLIYDRNYPAYTHLAHLAKRNRKFIMRCSRSSYKTARQMLQGHGDDSKRVILTPTHERKALVIQEDLPTQLELRFVRVRLSTGEDEVLVTNLLDEQVFPTSGFKELYNKRWGIETFFGLLKTRLELENFSGKTPLSIYQDFYASVFLTGMEAILTEDSNLQLASKTTHNPQKVNHAVSFNAIKNMALDLIVRQKDPEILLKKLTLLFMMNPVQVRPERQVPRIKAGIIQLHNYQKRREKICF
jgi:hypothetical protein